MNPYQYTYACSDRLYADYLKHGNLIIAIDFDDTVFDYKENGHTFEEIIELIKQAQDQNHILVMYSACKKERFPFIIDHMRKLGIEVAAVNANPFSMEYGNDGKIYYNILLDDKAGLGQAMMILRTTLNRIRDATL